MHTDNNLLTDLNTDLSLDASLLLNKLISDDANISQFFQTQISSIYQDTDTFIDSFNRSNNPLILSVNIQSLNSKYDALKTYINRLQCSGVPVDIIILQETWEIKNLSYFVLPGFQNIAFRTRDGVRGGGVGIYIRDGLNFKERKDLENYKLKTFENIVLEVFYPNKSILISNIYRSPNPPPNTTVSQHFDTFFETLDSHLSKLSEQNKSVYVFTDSNINLLRIGESLQCTEYIDTLITNGFLQIISKATRIQNKK